MRPASDTVVMLLAGGVGSRLNILARHRAKPAVPFGGAYRIIDFSLSNVMHSGLERVGLLTQYKPMSLMDHVGTGAAWDLVGRERGVRILPPQTGEENSDWYKGTADAIWQNIGFIRDYSPDKVLVLSGDHIYRMDYEAMIAEHEARGADLTIAAMPVPWEEVSRFGVMVPDGGNWIVEFLEKVTGAKSNLASMGVYVFNFRVLEEELAAVVGERKGFDFGKDVIPGMLGRRRLLCHPFRGYWRDVGTIKSYLEANMDCLNPDSGLALHVWQIRTAAEEIRLGDRLPARVTGDGAVVNSLVSPGCVVEGTVTNSVLSAGVRVARGASVRDSVVLQDTMLGPDSLTTYAILDKNCVVGKGAAVGLGPAAAPNRLNPSHLDCGITVVGKGALIPAGARIGRNSIIHPGVDLAAAGLVNVPGSSTVLENGETK